MPLKLKTQMSKKIYKVNYTLDLNAYPGSRKGLTFDIATGVTNAT